MINDDDGLYERLLPSDLWQVEAAAGLPEEEAQALADALEDMAVSVFLRNRDPARGDVWDVRLLLPGRPDEASLRARLGDIPFTTAPVEQKNWLQAVHADFPPLTIGRFFIYGSHYDGAVPDGLIPLKIDAATAFGSGEHETTQGCLLALEKLAEGRAVARALDMGCGSGILAVAMAKLWPEAEIAAVDIDPESTVVTRRHAEMNGVAARITAETGDGYAAPLARGAAPFDLVAANILAGPLTGMAGDLYAVLKPGGFCVLSGLLGGQMQAVAAAHTGLGLAPVSEEALGEWRTLVFVKPPF